MENQVSRVDQRLTMIMMHAPTGLAEIDESGEIIYLNPKAETLLKPFRVANNVKGNNIYPVLEIIAPSLVEKIKSSSDQPGSILRNELCSFSLCFGEENVERHFVFYVTRISANSIIVGFDDVTENRLKENAIMQLIADKAVEQGKFEIASNVLHDIGNAVVGFGSYINRIKQALEQNHSINLQKLSEFFATQQPALTDVLGEAKAGALMNLLHAVIETEKKNHEKISNSIKEQLSIINHIQEILTIQRQYLNGHTELEKKSTDLRAIIKDCMSMLYASIEKRGITISIKVPAGLPLINADHTRLMQVVLNLLKNSIEAIDVSAEEKHIEIQVRSKDNELVMEIQDTGNGFDTATGKRLFARGFTTKASGTGLGLTNCKSIIESHDGTIDIRSDGFGKGAVTTIKFKI